MLQDMKDESMPSLEHSLRDNQCYYITVIDLKLELTLEKVNVIATFDYMLDPVHGKPGDCLILKGHHVQLLEVRVNGAKLDTTRQTSSYYKLQGKHNLILNNIPPNGKIEIRNEIKPDAKPNWQGMLIYGKTLILNCTHSGLQYITFYLKRVDNSARITTIITAKRTDFPMVLATGTQLESADKNCTIWQDELKQYGKDFLVVAGNFVCRYINKARVYVSPEYMWCCELTVNLIAQLIAWCERKHLRTPYTNYSLISVYGLKASSINCKNLNIMPTNESLADVEYCGDDKIIRIITNIACNFLSAFAEPVYLTQMFLADYLGKSETQIRACKWLLRNPEPDQNDEFRSQLRRFVTIRHSGLNEWSQMQTLFTHTILQLYAKHKTRSCVEVPMDLIQAIDKIFEFPNLSYELKAEIFSLPDPNTIIAAHPQINIDRLLCVYTFLLEILGFSLEAKWRKLYKYLNEQQALEFNRSHLGLRQLKYVCLLFLVRSKKPEYIILCRNQLYTSESLQDQIYAVTILHRHQFTGRDTILNSAISFFNSQILLKPLASEAMPGCQALDCTTKVFDFLKQSFTDGSHATEIYDRFKKFSRHNFALFHDISGQGYQLLTDAIILIDVTTTYLALGLLTSFRLWDKFDEPRKGLMHQQLRRINSTPSISTVLQSHTDELVHSIPQFEPTSPRMVRIAHLGNRTPPPRGADKSENFGEMDFVAIDSARRHTLTPP